MSDDQVYRCKLRADGMITIPARMRRELNIRAGDRIEWTIEDGRITARFLNMLVLDLEPDVYAAVVVSAQRLGLPLSDYLTEAMRVYLEDLDAEARAGVRPIEDVPLPREEP